MVPFVDPSLDALSTPELALHIDRALTLLNDRLQAEHDGTAAATELERELEFALNAWDPFAAYFTD